MHTAVAHSPSTWLLALLNDPTRLDLTYETDSDARFIPDSLSAWTSSDFSDCVRAHRRFSDGHKSFQEGIWCASLYLAYKHLLKLKTHCTSKQDAATKGEAQLCDLSSEKHRVACIFPSSTRYISASQRMAVIKTDPLSYLPSLTEVCPHRPDDPIPLDARKQVNELSCCFLASIEDADPF